MPEHLMGAAEIRHRLGGITRQRVYQLTRRPDWPPPYDKLMQGHVWRREDIEAWISRNRPTAVSLRPEGSPATAPGSAPPS